MNYWVCVCGKKVSENKKECPYCKALRLEEINVVSADTQYLKIIIALLSVVIVAGAIYMFTRGGNAPTAAESKPMYVGLQQPSQSTPGNQSSTPAKKIVPPVAIEAVNALKKLQARTQVGITYKDYAPALGEAKFALNLFSESTQAKEFPELAQLLTSAYDTFKMAGAVWDDKFSGRRYAYLDDHTFKSYYPELFAKYPDADQETANGGILFRTDGKELINIGTAVSFLFSKANQDIQKASALIER